MLLYKYYNHICSMGYNLYFEFRWYLRLLLLFHSSSPKTSHTNTQTDVEFRTFNVNFVRSPESPSIPFNVSSFLNSSSSAQPYQIWHRKRKRERGRESGRSQYRVNFRMGDIVTGRRHLSLEGGRERWRVQIKFYLNTNGSESPINSERKSCHNQIQLNLYTQCFWHYA